MRHLTLGPVRRRDEARKRRKHGANLMRFQRLRPSVTPNTVPKPAVSQRQSRPVQPFLEDEMRVPLLALGLLSTSFVRAAAQGQAAVKDPAQCAVADANRSPMSYSHVRPSDPHDRARTGCSPVAPVQTPPPPPPPPPNTGTITGTVRDANTGAGLAGWVVMAIGPTTVTTTTDAGGNYTLTVPAATYVVCEQLQTGWQQVSPMFPEPCPTGFGYNFPVDVGLNSPFVNFGNQAL